MSKSNSRGKTSKKSSESIPCNHVPVELYVEFEGKKYPNCSVRGYPMIRCQICDSFGERRGEDLVWSKEKKYE